MQSRVLTVPLATKEIDAMLYMSNLGYDVFGSDEVDTPTLSNRLAAFELLLRSDDPDVVRYVTDAVTKMAQKYGVIASTCAAVTESDICAFFRNRSSRTLDLDKNSSLLAVFLLWLCRLRFSRVFFGRHLKQFVAAGLRHLLRSPVTCIRVMGLHCVKSVTQSYSELQDVLQWLLTVCIDGLPSTLPSKMTEAHTQALCDVIQAIALCYPCVDMCPLRQQVLSSILPYTTVLPSSFIQEVYTFIKDQTLTFGHQDCDASDGGSFSHFVASLHTFLVLASVPEKMSMDHWTDLLTHTVTLGPSVLSSGARHAVLDMLSVYISGASDCRAPKYPLCDVISATGVVFRAAAVNGDTPKTAINDVLQWCCLAASATSGSVLRAQWALALLLIVRCQHNTMEPRPALISLALNRCIVDQTLSGKVRVFAGFVALIRAALNGGDVSSARAALWHSRNSTKVDAVDLQASFATILATLGVVIPIHAKSHAGGKGLLDELCDVLILLFPMDPSAGFPSALRDLTVITLGSLCVYHPGGRQSTAATAVDLVLARLRRQVHSRVVTAILDSLNSILSTQSISPSMVINGQVALEDQVHHSDHHHLDEISWVSLASGPSSSRGSTPRDLRYSPVPLSPSIGDQPVPTPYVASSFSSADSKPDHQACWPHTESSESLSVSQKEKQATLAPLERLPVPMSRSHNPHSTVPLLRAGVEPTDFENQLEFSTEGLSATPLVPPVVSREPVAHTPREPHHQSRMTSATPDSASTNDRTIVHEDSHLSSPAPLSLDELEALVKQLNADLGSHGLAALSLPGEKESMSKAQASSSFAKDLVTQSLNVVAEKQGRASVPKNFGLMVPQTEKRRASSTPPSPKTFSNPGFTHGLSEQVVRIFRADPSLLSPNIQALIESDRGILDALGMRESSHGSSKYPAPENGIALDLPDLRTPLKPGSLAHSFETFNCLPQKNIQRTDATDRSGATQTSPMRRAPSRGVDMQTDATDRSGATQTSPMRRAPSRGVDMQTDATDRSGATQTSPMRRAPSRGVDMQTDATDRSGATQTSPMRRAPSRGVDMQTDATDRSGATQTSPMRRAPSRGVDMQTDATDRSGATQTSPMRRAPSRGVDMQTDATDRSGATQTSPMRRAPSRGVDMHTDATDRSGATQTSPMRRAPSRGVDMQTDATDRSGATQTSPMRRAPSRGVDMQTDATDRSGATQTSPMRRAPSRGVDMQTEPLGTVGTTQTSPMRRAPSRGVDMQTEPLGTVGTTQTTPIRLKGATMQTNGDVIARPLTLSSPMVAFDCPSRPAVSFGGLQEPDGTSATLSPLTARSVDDQNTSSTGYHDASSTMTPFTPGAPRSYALGSRIASLNNIANVGDRAKTPKVVSIYTADLRLSDETPQFEAPSPSPSPPRSPVFLSPPSSPRTQASPNSLSLVPSFSKSPEIQSRSQRKPSLRELNRTARQVQEQQHQGATAAKNYARHRDAVMHLLALLDISPDDPTIRERELKQLNNIPVEMLEALFADEKKFLSAVSAASASLEDVLLTLYEIQTDRPSA